MSLCERVKAVFNEVNYQCRLLGELVYPRRCAVCKNEIDTGYFCEACRKNFALGKMLMQVDNIDEVFLCYKYHQELQEALQNVKFAGQKDLLPLLKEEAQLALEDVSDLEKVFLKYDIICCVPTSPERKAERGFDVPCEIFAFLDFKKWQRYTILIQLHTLSLVIVKKLNILHTPISEFAYPRGILHTPISER